MIPAPVWSASPRLLIVLLIVVSALNPIAINMFVPAMPDIMRGLATDQATIQLVLSVYLFSTAVEDVSIPEMRRGVCKSTGGTDIACVAEHIAKNGISRALVVTDGWVGRPTGEHLAILSRTKLAVTLFGPSTQKGDLEAVADHLVELEPGDRT